MAASAFLSILLHFKAGSDLKFFMDRWTPLTFGIQANLPSYVLFWTLAYNVIHVFDAY
jgi:EMC6